MSGIFTIGTGEAAHVRFSLNAIPIHADGLERHDLSPHLQIKDPGYLTSGRWWVPKTDSLSALLTRVQGYDPHPTLGGGKLSDLSPARREILLRGLPPELRSLSRPMLAKMIMKEPETPDNLDARIDRLHSVKWDLMHCLGDLLETQIGAFNRGVSLLHAPDLEACLLEREEDVSIPDLSLPPETILLLSAIVEKSNFSDEQIAAISEETPPLNFNDTWLHVGHQLQEGLVFYWVNLSSELGDPHNGRFPHREISVELGAEIYASDRWVRVVDIFSFHSRGPLPTGVGSLRARRSKTDAGEDAVVIGGARLQEVSDTEPGETTIRLVPTETMRSTGDIPRKVSFDRFGLSHTIVLNAVDAVGPLEMPFWEWPRGSYNTQEWPLPSAFKGGKNGILICFNRSGPSFQAIPWMVPFLCYTDLKQGQALPGQFGFQMLQQHPSPNDDARIFLANHVHGNTDPIHESFRNVASRFDDVLRIFGRYFTKG